MFNKKDKKVSNQNNTFYTLDRLDKEAPNAQIILIAGEKGNGKSYAVKERLLTHWRDTGEKFVYLRRFDSDTTASKTERIFSDLKNLDEMTGGYNFIGALAGTLFAHKLGATVGDLKRKEGLPIGYYGSIDRIIKGYSSVPFPFVSRVFLDEVTALGTGYLPDEIFLFDVCLSTILRRNKQAIVYIAGNTWDRYCPYYRKYGIDVSKLEQGEIKYFDYTNSDGTSFKVGFERCVDLAENNNPLIVTGRDSIISGKWYETPHPILDNLKDYQIAYEFYLETENRIYKCNYIVNGMDSAIYVEEYDEETPPQGKRLITKNISTNALTTPKFYPLTNEEGLIFNLLKIGKVFYSDNLTGTEFDRAYKYFS